MNFYIDIFTLTNVSTTFYSILLVLLFLFWNQNKDIKSIIWWCGFPLFRIINSIISSDSVYYDNEVWIYLGNLSIIISDVLLMIGCLKFSNLKINYYYIAALISLFSIISTMQFNMHALLNSRIQSIVLFDTIIIIISIYALSKLETDKYCLEKFFTIFWMSIQFIVFAIWMVDDFKIINVQDVYLYDLGLSAIYLSHIFILVGLIILAIAKRRNQLIAENIIFEELEKTLTITLTNAQIANEEKANFLTNMSHVLRTPLNAIIGFSESLKLEFYGTLNIKQTDYANNINEGGQLLLKLITDLLNLSNIEDGKVEITLEEINLNHLINKTKPLLNEIISHSNVSLIINNKLNEDCIFPCALVDQIRTKQILINFVSNAVKYGNKNGTITVELNDFDQDYFRISVQDEGVGIAQDQYENIFKPFNRAGSEKTNIEGIGVGLSIAKNLVEQMHGSIGFSSKIDVGSVFWINIPKSKQRNFSLI